MDETAPGPDRRGRWQRRRNTEGETSPSLLEPRNDGRANQCEIGRAEASFGDDRGKGDGVEGGGFGTEDGDDEGFWAETAPRTQRAVAKPAEKVFEERSLLDGLGDARPARTRGRKAAGNEAFKALAGTGPAADGTMAAVKVARPSLIKHSTKSSMQSMRPQAKEGSDKAQQAGAWTRLESRVQSIRDDAVVAAREEERSVLDAIYGGEFEIVSDAEWRIHLGGPPGAPVASLHVLLPEDYPLCQGPPAPVVNSDCITDHFKEASAAAVQALLEEWEPSNEGCVYQWAERLREALRPALEDEASTATAEALANAELVSAQVEADAATQDVALDGFTFLPAHSQDGQRLRHFDAASFDACNAVDILHGEPFTDRKSTFQAHASKVASMGQVQWVLRTLLSDRKIASATHNISAYRFQDPERRVQVADNEDDGETGAGAKLADLLRLAGCDGVLVMVSRWYGGIHLGNDRFKHINRAASALLDEAGWSNRNRSGAGPGGSKAKAASRK